ncbi:MAG: WD40 repeat domain-containing protein, partial [Planctomycetes bacterium]|nr:WD40 repeat domain-containing protein [Planctomycetota bacterium]
MPQFLAGGMWFLLSVLGAPTLCDGQKPPALVQTTPLTRPILRARSDVPLGVIRQLRFDRDRDGRLWLYSAGDDKVVRRYLINEAPFELLPIQVLRWPIARGDRGLIYAMDVGHWEGRSSVIAIGGIGAYCHSQVNLLSPSDPQQGGVILNSDYLGPHQIVWSLAFAPRRPLLAIGYGGDRKNAPIAFYRIPDDNLRQLNDQPSRVWQFRTPFDQVDFLAFSPKGDKLLAAEMNSGHVRIYDVPHQPEGRASPTLAGEISLSSLIYGAAWENQTTWVVATWGRGLVRNGKLAEGVALPAAVSSVCCSSTKSLTAVAIFESPAGRDGAGGWRVVLFDSDTGQVIPLARSDFNDLISVLAFSPDGRYLAAAGESRSAQTSDARIPELRIWSTESGRLLGRYPPASYQPTMGAGISSVRVLTGADDEAIGFAHGPFPTTLAERPERLVPPPKLQYRWSLRRPGKLMPILSESEAAEPRAQRWLLQRKRDGGYWLRRANGDGRKIGPFPSLPQHGYPHAAVTFHKSQKKFLAVGYDFGILVWDEEAVQSGKAMRFEGLHEAIARGFWGHDVAVTCLAVPSGNDPDWMVSGAADGTICVWSLRTLRPDVSERNELMATFDMRAGELFVADGGVDRTGPAYAAGLREGQRILDVIVPREEQPEADWPVPRSGWLQALRYPIPGRVL